MPWTRLSPQSRVALGLVVAIVLLFVVFFVALSSAGPSTAGDQCAKPVSERTGGWVCPG